MTTTEKVVFLEQLANEIRTSAIETIWNAKSGHLGACCSSTELMTALYFGGILKYDPKNPKNPDRDRVYVRGHVGPLRYKIFSLLGWIDETELKTYRKLGSRLKGHESMLHTPGVDLTPSGSLGMLLSYAIGAAIETKNQKRSCKHYVFLGDGEEQEGNVSEAARHCSTLDLNNIIAIIDKNGKQLSRFTNEVDQANTKKIWEGYGWNVHEILDGHNIEEILQIFSKINSSPTVIIAHTIKGKGLENCVEHFNGYHTLSSCKNKEIVQKAIEVGKEKSSKYSTKEFKKTLENTISSIKTSNCFKQEKEINKEYRISINPDPSNSINLDDAQIHYFKELGNVAKEQKIPLYFITPDFVYKNLVKLTELDRNSTYIDTGIREQHTIAMAHGISTENPNARVFINYGDAFLYRGSDQLNAAAQGKSNLILLLESSGITQGTNGESHHSSGQPAIPLFMPGVNFYEPADVKDLYNVLNHCFSTNSGINVIRSHRANIPLLNRTPENINNIDNYVAYEEVGEPDITLIGSGFIVSRLIEAAQEIYNKDRLKCKVINLINLKKMDEKFLRKISSNKPVLTVYNGNGSILQSAISKAVMETSITRPSKIIGHGFNFGDTGSIEDLIKHFGFDKENLAKMIRRIVD